MTLKTNLIALALIVVLRDPRRLPARDAALSGPSAGDHAARAAARAAAGGGRDRAARRLRAPGPARRDARRGGHHRRLHAARGRARRDLRREPLLRPHGDRGLRGRRRDLLDASRTLGAGPARTFARVALPLAAGGLGAGAAMAFARGLGEFGATIMFAGSLQGVTQTVSLAIYQEFDVNLDVALAISALLVLVSGAILLSVKLVSARPPFVWTSPPRFARSGSSSRSRSAARRSRWSGRRAPARRRCCARSPGSLGRDAGSIALGDEVWFDARAADRPAARGARGRLRLPGLRALPAPERARERRVRRRGAGRRAARALRDRAARASAAAGALGRRAPAGRARASASARPARCSCSTSRSRRSTRTRGATSGVELQGLLRELGLPTLLVTHDFEDAAALADRVGVLLDGRLLQLGTAAELVDSPADPFVASLTGGNLLPGRARRPGADGLTEVVLDGGEHRALERDRRRAGSASWSSPGRSRWRRAGARRLRSQPSAGHRRRRSSRSETAFAFGSARSPPR